MCWSLCLLQLVVSQACDTNIVLCLAAAGPLFDDADSMSFFNLELADTNIVVRNPC